MIKILGLDIAYYEGYAVVGYNPNTKNIKILDYGIISVKNKKTHKAFYLHQATKNLIDSHKPNIVIIEEQFYRSMYEITGTISAAVPPSTELLKIFSKRARKLAFDDGSLEKEEAGKKVIELFPELKEKESDILDAMVLILALIKAMETKQSLKLPKKQKGLTNSKKMLSLKKKNN